MGMLYLKFEYSQLIYMAPNNMKQLMTDMLFDYLQNCIDCVLKGHLIPKK
jgi:hypothetical protein